MTRTIKPTLIILLFSLVGACSIWNKDFPSRSISSLNNEKTLIQSLGVYISPPRGGYGDVISNWIMIKKLKELYPDLKLVAFYDEKSAEVLEKLIPKFNNKLNKQTVSAIEMFHIDAPGLPRLDVIASFSSQVSPPKQIEPLAKYITFFLEYTGSVSRSNHVEPIKESILSQFAAAPSGIQQMGLYLSPNQPPHRLSLKELEGEINEQLTEKIKLDQNFKLAHSYTNTEFTQRTYLKLVAEAAETDQLKDEKILIIAKYFKDQQEVTLPKNVQVVYFDRLDFSTIQEIIAHSNFPNLITGDASLTLAMDYKKPFIYECNNWKLDAFLDINGHILLESDYQEELQDISLRVATFPSDKQANKLKKIMTSQQVQEQFIMALDKIKKKPQLPQNMMKFINIIKIYNELPLEGKKDALDKLPFQERKVLLKEFPEFFEEVFKDSNRYHELVHEHTTLFPSRPISCPKRKIQFLQSNP